MNESPNLFADGKAYERLMGRWSRLAGEKFLDWLSHPWRIVDLTIENGGLTEPAINRFATSCPIELAPGPVAVGGPLMALALDVILDRPRGSQFCEYSIAMIVVAFTGLVPCSNIRTRNARSHETISLKLAVITGE